MSSESLTNCEPDRKYRTKPEQAYRIHGPFHIFSKSYALQKMPVGSVMATQKSKQPRHQEELLLCQLFG